MLKLYLLMASISLILILITVNVQFSDSNCQDTNVATNLDNVNNNVKNNNFKFKLHYIIMFQIMNIKVLKKKH